MPPRQSKEWQIILSPLHLLIVSYVGICLGSLWRCCCSCGCGIRWYRPARPPRSRLSRRSRDCWSASRCEHSRTLHACEPGRASTAKENQDVKNAIFWAKSSGTYSYQFITEVVAALLGNAQRGFAIVVLDVRVGTGPEIIASSTKLIQDMMYGWKFAASKLMGKLVMLPEKEPHGLALVLYCAVVERSVSFPGLPVQRWGVLDNEVHQVEPLPAVDVGTRHGRYRPVQRQWC